MSPMEFDASTSKASAIWGYGTLRFFSGFLVASAILSLSIAAIPALAAQKIEVEAGAIWNQADAQNKCPQVAAANGGVWTGQWRTTVPGRMSVCEIRLSKPNGRRVENVEAGPIWNDSDAQSKCPGVASASGGVWTGQWHTTIPGRMSVCEVRFSGRRPPIVKEFNAGPIFSQADAQTKCPQVAASNGGVWTGQWRTTVPGQMSVCEVRINR